MIQVKTEDAADTTRTVTFSCDLSVELIEVLEEYAARNGRTFEAELIDYLATTAPKPRPKLSPEEAERRRRAFESHFGEWDSGDPDSSDNERIDADLAREYADDHESEEN